MSRKTAWQPSKVFRFRRYSLLVCLCVAVLLHATILLIDFEMPNPSKQTRVFDVTIISQPSKAPSDADFNADQASDGGRNDDDGIRHDEATSRYEKHNQSGTQDGQQHTQGSLSQHDNQQHNPDASPTALAFNIVVQEDGDLRVAKITGTLPTVQPGLLSIARRLEESPDTGQLDNENMGQRVASPTANDTDAVNPRARQQRYARYIYAWRTQVEQHANQYYLPKAKLQQHSGTVSLKIRILHDGSIHSAQVAKSSEKKLLDETALYIIHQSAPFQPFPAAIKRETDYLEFVYEYHFGQRLPLKP